MGPASRIRLLRVAPEDAEKVFTAAPESGPVDVETRLLEKDGKPLCGACFLYVR